MRDEKNEIGSSFRDPSGSIFCRDGEIFRKVNFYYKDDYDYLKASGLYKKLVSLGYLVSHKEEKLKEFKNSKGAYKIIKPETIPFISYPFEWCFSQLKDAALLTLKINKIALEYGMILKDASAYNIQFYKGKPMLIDTLSFERYQEGQIWKGYKQFCKHFLSPLALAAFKDFRLTQLLRNFIDGIPLGLTREMLPLSAKLNPGIIAHIILQSKSEEYLSRRNKFKKDIQIKKDSLIAIINNLENLIEGLKIKKRKTEWGNYYCDNNYSDLAMHDKYEKTQKFFKLTKAKKSVWDLGANDGYFSRISSSRGVLTISFDNDEEAVERNYQKVKSEKEAFLLPLYLDLTNPTPSFGWASEERDSLVKRGPTDCIFALALIHHLAISNNLPFKKIAKFFSLIGKWLIIEFVPKSDSQVRRMLSAREDIFNEYRKDYFEESFSHYFRIVRSDKIEDSERFLYLMKKK